MKIPLRYPNKPSDEIELTEREEALIEKERSFESNFFFFLIIVKNRNQNLLVNRISIL